MARNYSSVVEPKTLTGTVGTAATQITLNNVTGLPSPPYVLVLNPDTAKEEAVLVTVDQTGVTSPTLKVTRSIEESGGIGVAQDHTIGDTVKHMIVGSDLQLVHNHLDNTTTAHGVTGEVVGTTKAQELTLKTLTAPKINENVNLTATSTELNILDGATLTTTELNYVDGVTSAIQTQLNTKSPIANPTFTGTVGGVTKSMVGLGNVDNTSDAGKPVSSATLSALEGKLSLTGGTISGNLDTTGQLQATQWAPSGAAIRIRADGSDGLAIIQFTNNAINDQRSAIVTTADKALQLISTKAFWGAIWNTPSVSGTVSTVSINNSGQLYRTSSSEKYKKDIEDLQHEVADKILELRPVTYRAKNPIAEVEENWSHVGLIAEEVAEIEPRLVVYAATEVEYDESGNIVYDESGNVKSKPLETPVPEGVQYEKLAIYLLDIVKREKARSNNLEQRLIALEAKVAELEAK
jgi:hypothetical protein